MANPLVSISFRKVLLLYLLLLLFTSIFFCSSSEPHARGRDSFSRRRFLEDQPKKISTENQTKLLKSNQSLKNQTKVIKFNLSTKNQTKLTKTTNSTKSTSNSNIVSKIELKKLNSTSKLKKFNSTSKAANSTKPTSFSTKKSSGLLKLNAPNNKTSKPTSTKQTPVQLDEKLTDPESQKSNKSQKPDKKIPDEEKKPRKQTKLPSWIDQDDEDDLHRLVTEFRDLPTKFQKTLIPDLENFTTSYISEANKHITRRFKPIVGNKYAKTTASIASFAFIFIPLILVSLIWNRIKAYFSLQRILIFVQVYLCIYFSILCLSALVTGLEPLKFFNSTSQSSYVCLQVMQTLGYVFYLLMLLMYLILVFSTECGLGSKMLGLFQTFVGFAIGLHYYMAVFHRMVLHQPPKTNWKVHGIYATCFLVVCLFAGADRRKKAYLEGGGEEGKKS